LRWRGVALAAGQRYLLLKGGDATVDPLKCRHS
jgi:hypothetical protein